MSGRLTRRKTKLSSLVPLLVHSGPILDLEMGREQRLICTAKEEEQPGPKVGRLQLTMRFVL